MSPLVSETIPEDSFLIITIQYVLKGLVNAQRQNKEMRYKGYKEGTFIICRCMNDYLYKNIRESTEKLE